MIEIKGPKAPRSSRSPRSPGGSALTIRGTISGALREKFGLTVQATRTREVGPLGGRQGSLTVSTTSSRAAEIAP